MVEGYELVGKTTTALNWLKITKYVKRFLKQINRDKSQKRFTQLNRSGLLHFIGEGPTPLMVVTLSQEQKKNEHENAKTTITLIKY